MSTIGPALSGMLAAQAQLQASAQRIAGVSRVGASAPADEPQAAKPQASGSAPVPATPKRPQSAGYFFHPEPEEVDPAQEQLAQMQALNQFKANLQALLAGDQMTRTALEI
jgi:hypothetical protein